MSDEKPQDTHNFIPVQEWMNKPCVIVDPWKVVFPEKLEMSFFIRRDFDEIAHRKELEVAICSIYMMNHNETDVILTYKFGVHGCYCTTTKDNIQMMPESAEEIKND